MKLDRSEVAFLELLRIGLHTKRSGFDFETLSDEEWRSAFNEASEQAVSLICFDALGRVESRPDKELYDRLLKKSLGFIKTATVLEAQHKALDKLLCENGIDYAVLKGFSSGYYYPDPEKRACGDIDFIVPREQLTKAKELLLREGFVMEPDMNDVHYTFCRDGVYYELHKTIAGLPEHPVRRFFEESLSGLTERASYSGGFKKPCDKDHAIVIFLHTLHHMLSTGLGIRQLCDWACFVERTHSDPFWQEDIIPLFSKTGTITFVTALTECCVECLGIERPCWCKTVPIDTRDAFMREILRAGNLGRKNKDRGTASLMFAKDGKKLTGLGKVRHMIKSLNETNKKVYPVLCKAPWLYPFIVVYRVLRYMVLVLLGKRKKLSDVSREASAKNEVFLKFELFKVEE